MRKLWPEVDTSKLYPNKAAISKEDYDTLIALINNNKESIESVKKALDDYKEQLLSSISTIQMTATTANVTNAVIDNLTSTLLESITANIENLTVDRITALVDASLNSANIDNLRSDSAILNEAHISNLDGGEASFNTIKANTAEIDNYDITNLSATNATLSNITSNKAEIESASVLELNSDTIDVVDLKADSSTLTSSNITEADITNLEYEFAINDNDSWQDIIDNDEYVYIELPEFENGTYYLTGIDTSNNDKLFSIELLNSINNRLLRWSDSPLKYLEEAYDLLPNFVIKINTHNKAIRLYHRADTFDTFDPPTIRSIYTEPADNDTRYYKITYQNGNKVFKPLDLFNEGSAVGVLTLNQTTDFNNTTEQDPTIYDTTEDVSRSYYIPNQDVNKEADVEFKNLLITEDTELDGNIYNKSLYVGSKAKYESIKDNLTDYALVVVEE